MPPPTDLTRLSTADLATTLAATEAGRLTAPLTTSRIAAAGLAVDAAALTAACADLQHAALVAALSAALAERRRPKPTLELVWTGPDPSFSTTRDTPRALQHLFASARREVLVAGFSFDHGATLFAPLHTAMVAHGAQCDLFIDIPGDQRDVSLADERPLVTDHVAAFVAGNWPWPTRPRFFYDPRRFDPDVFASIHAKCVVVDRRRAFVTSANFTARGHTRNVEVGLLIDAPHLAESLAGQLRRCVAERLFRQVPDDWLPPPPPEAPTP